MKDFTNALRLVIGTAALLGAGIFALSLFTAVVPAMAMVHYLPTLSASIVGVVFTVMLYYRVQNERYNKRSSTMALVLGATLLLGGGVAMAYESPLRVGERSVSCESVDDCTYHDRLSGSDFVCYRGLCHERSVTELTPEEYCQQVEGGYHHQTTCSDLDDPTNGPAQAIGTIQCNFAGQGPRSYAMCQQHRCGVVNWVQWRCPPDHVCHEQRGCVPE